MTETSSIARRWDESSSQLEVLAHIFDVGRICSVVWRLRSQKRAPAFRIRQRSVWNGPSKPPALNVGVIDNILIGTLHEL